jgi:hypothetical protein
MLRSRKQHTVKLLTTHFYVHGQIKIPKRLPVEDSASCKRNCKSKSRPTFIKYFVTKISVLMQSSTVWGNMKGGLLVVL